MSQVQTLHKCQAYMRSPSVMFLSRIEFYQHGWAEVVKVIYFGVFILCNIIENYVRFCGLEVIGNWVYLWGEHWAVRESQI